MQKFNRQACFPRIANEINQCLGDGGDQWVEAHRGEEGRAPPAMLVECLTTPTTGSRHDGQKLASISPTKTPKIYLHVAAQPLARDTRGQIRSYPVQKHIVLLARRLPTHGPAADGTR